MEEKELKTRSIRADEATFEKFKAIASESFGNQGQCLEALLALYDLESNKRLIPERSMEIETFQAHLNSVGDMFVASLQLNQDAELRMRSKFEALLISKDQLIADLQNKANICGQELKTAKDLRQAALVDLVEEKKRVKDLQAIIDTKEKLIAALEEKSEKDVRALADMAAEKVAYSERQKYQVDIENDNAALRRELTELAAQMEAEQAKATLVLERKLLEKDRQYQETLNKLREEQYQQLQAQINKADTFRDEVDALRKVNADLNQQLSEIRAIDAKN